MSPLRGEICFVVSSEGRRLNIIYAFVDSSAMNQCFTFSWSVLPLPWTSFLASLELVSHLKMTLHSPMYWIRLSRTLSKAVILLCGFSTLRDSSVLDDVPTCSRFGPSPSDVLTSWFCCVPDDVLTSLWVCRVGGDGPGETSKSVADSGGWVRERALDASRGPRAWGLPIGCRGSLTSSRRRSSSDVTLDTTGAARSSGVKGTNEELEEARGTSVAPNSRRRTKYRGWWPNPITRLLLFFNLFSILRVIEPVILTKSAYCNICSQNLEFSHS